MQGTQRAQGREREKSAAMGHHLLEKASLPWRVMLCGVVEKKTGGQPRYTHLHTRVACPTREILWRVARAGNVHREVVRAEKKKGYVQGAK